MVSVLISQLNLGYVFSSAYWEMKSRIGFKMTINFSSANWEMKSGIDLKRWRNVDHCLLLAPLESLNTPPLPPLTTPRWITRLFYETDAAFSLRFEWATTKSSTVLWVTLWITARFEAMLDRGDSSEETQWNLQQNRTKLVPGKKYLHSISEKISLYSFSDILGLKPAPNDGTPGSLRHLLDPSVDIDVLETESDGKLMRTDICRKPAGFDNCSQCICKFCVSGEMLFFFV